MTKRLKVRDFGTSLYFNGADSVVSVATNPVLTVNSTTARTIALAIKPSVPSGYFLSRNGGTGDGFRANVSSTGKIGTIWENDGALINLPTINSVRLGEWNYLIISMSNEVWSVYLNGVKTTLTFAARVFSPANGLLIGKAYIGQFFSGFIDEIRVFDSFFSDQDAENLYNHNIVKAGKLLEWKFDEGSGATAEDTSGNNYDGTNANATYSSDVMFKLRTLIA